VQFNAARAHEVDASFRRFVAIFKRPFLLGLAPKHFVIAVRVERRVNVDQIHAGIGQFLEFLQIVAAVDEARIHERGGFRRKEESLSSPCLRSVAKSAPLRQAQHEDKKREADLASLLCLVVEFPTRP
jgi:hypothetical protein